MADVRAHRFPRELDGHPLLAWMGDDWVTHVVLALLEELRRQDPATDMLAIGCTGEVELETRGSGDAVASVLVRIPVQMLLRDGTGAEHHVEGLATLGGPDPRTVALELGATPQERMSGVLRSARALVARPGNDFTWSSWEDAGAALGELDELIGRLRLRPVPKREMAGLFAPTGPMHELALASGWAGEFGALADRFDALRMVARDSWSCRVCGEDAGAIELRESGELRRESFTGVLTQPDVGDAFGRLWDAIADGDAAGLHAIDPELAPWWCPACEASYCGGHWRWRDVFDPEEPAFRDQVRGSCPQGHERMLED